MAEHKIVINLDEKRTMEISTGKVAGLANGSCLVRMNDTIVLVAACSGPAREDADFFPLQVDYREKYSAAGKFPGGYIKREGRPSTREILTCRVTDRPLRPLFPEGFYDEVQIQSLLLSAEGETEPDVLVILGASVALTLSDLPFQGPIGAVRVGKINGQYIANPSNVQMRESTIDLIYAGSPDKVIMIEGSAEFCSEQEMKEAMYFANEIVKIQVAAQLELQKVAGKTKKTPKLYLVPPELDKKLIEFCTGRIEDMCLIPGKTDRLEALNALQDEVTEFLTPEFGEIKNFKIEIRKGFDNLVRTCTRRAILEKHYRPDGRGIEDIRPLSAEVAVLPVVHGSALFSRGETQAMVIATLGNEKDAQEADCISDGAFPSKVDRFYLHYNFPNFSVGEVGRITGPGRREIGHGDLAERSVSKVVPKDFPYVVRCVSEIMSSNGSTSMATVCGATLALMDAGVPIKEPVAGISCGLVTDENQVLLLTDIIGAEDHFGDMDFKVCGTRTGITGFQLDLKLPGIPIDLLCEGMERDRVARMKILDVIEACINKPREEISPRAPRIEVLHINPSKIGALIGPGGKNIKAITEETQSSIDVNDEGEVKIMAPNMEFLKMARERVQSCTAEAEIGQTYRGKVVSVRDFGAFVEILPGLEGLLHISEMADYRVRQVSDICNEGDYVTVKVIDIAQDGKVRLSRKAALKDMEEAEGK